MEVRLRQGLGGARIHFTLRGSGQGPRARTPCSKMRLFHSRAALRALPLSLRAAATLGAWGSGPLPAPRCSPVSSKTTQKQQQQQHTLKAQALTRVENAKDPVL